MELTDMHIEAIKTAARSVDYGSVTLNISADKPDRLELNVQNRIRLESEPTTTKDAAPRKNGNGYRN